MKKDSIKSISIDDASVAAMLFTLGFTQTRKAIQIEKANGKTKYVYFFKDVSEDETYKLKDVLEKWEDKTYHLENPSEELSIIKMFFNNKNVILDEIKSGAGLMLEVENNGVNALINAHSAPHEVREFFEQ